MDRENVDIVQRLLEKSFTFTLDKFRNSAGSDTFKNCSKYFIVNTSV